MVSSFPGWTSNNYFYQSCIWDAGATVVISDILDALRYLRVTHLRVVPATLVNILSAPPDALQRNDALRVFVGGAPLSKQLAKQAKQRLTRHIFTQIGSTEASPITLTPVEGPDDLRWHRLIPEREVQILDEYDRVLPAGQVGRVRIRLQDGAPEYLDDPEANRIFFRSGYFYPGDLGVIGPDGRFALRGRVAEIINVQGMKLASGPIEEMLRDRFNVSGVCVFSGPDATGDEIVYVVIESRKLIKPADVETTLRTIPAPKFAVQLYQVEALPRNHMGKIQYSVVKKRLGIS
jgi:acyl-CoA synthetase (AMP-forming)/AMP-acid ligase II